MTKERKPKRNVEKTSRPSGTSEDAVERKLINLAVDLAAKQMEDGTATSQVVTHFLKLATSKANLELEILRKQSAFLTAKTDALESVKRVEELTDAALQAMRSYTGVGGENGGEDS